MRAESSFAESKARRANVMEGFVLGPARVEPVVPLS